MGKTRSKPLAAWHDRGTAWAWHVIWELALIITIIIIIIFINSNWVVTRWQWLFYIYTKYEIGY